MLRGIVGTRYRPESHGTDSPRPTYGCSLPRRQLGIGTNVQGSTREPCNSDGTATDSRSEAKTREMHIHAEIVYVSWPRLDAEGIHPTNEKLLALQQALIPTCVTELRSYVGLVNYYHKFLNNVSAVLKPLYELLQSGTSWHWGLSQQRAFEASKALLQSSKVLVHYNSRLPLVLSCDASPYGIGAVLSHRMADGSDIPIALASRTLAPADKRYTQIEREGLAIVFGVTKFHNYVYGRDFEI